MSISTRQIALISGAVGLTAPAAASAVAATQLKPAVRDSYVHTYPDGRTAKVRSDHSDGYFSKQDLTMTVAAAGFASPFVALIGGMALASRTKVNLAGKHSWPILAGGIGGAFAGSTVSAGVMALQPVTPGRTFTSTGARAPDVFGRPEGT